MKHPYALESFEGQTNNTSNIHVMHALLCQTALLLGIGSALNFQDLYHVNEANFALVRRSNGWSRANNVDHIVSIASVTEDQINVAGTI
jgi:hypothetical protein